MKIGINLDFRNPPRWQREWSFHYRRSLEHVEDADRLGLDSVWLGEHHFFEDGYLPQPLQMAAAIAVRTKRLRIGTSIVQAPLRPAIDLAEQAAIADLLSEGRFELGLGAGYRIPEFVAFGADIKKRYPALEQRVTAIREYWENGNLTPPPLQERIPIWIGGTGPRASRMAGRLGEGLLSLQLESLDAYREGLVEGGRSPADARLSGPINLVLADDPERAEAVWREVGDHFAYSWQTYMHYGAEGSQQGSSGAQVLSEFGGDEITGDSLRYTGVDMNMPHADVVTPTQAIRRIRAWLGEAPVVHGYFWASIAGMPDDIVARHIELLATIQPAVADIGTSEPPR